MTDRNDSGWVRESVIETVREEATPICRSGAWLALEDEAGTIHVYHHDEALPPEADDD